MLAVITALAIALVAALIADLLFLQTVARWWPCRADTYSCSSDMNPYFLWTSAVIPMLSLIAGIWAARRMFGSR